MIQFSIVVPTLNESENIDLLLARLFALNIPSNTFEVIFVDDSSNDGTPDKIRAWQRHANVHLIERSGNPDLMASVLAGTDAAHSDIIVVMDADLSHPHEQLNALVEPLLHDHYDIVIGSRYIDGGGILGWTFYRHMLSRIGGWLARPFCDVSDATSGFFAFRRELATNISERARGYKILLEILMANGDNLRIKEIPILFRDRAHGTSKLSLSHQLVYLQRLMTLVGGSVSAGTAGRFAAVGLLGVLVDVLVFQWMISRETGLALAHIISFIVAVGVNYIMNATWSFRSSDGYSLQWNQFSRFFIVGALALLLRGGVLALFVYTLYVPPSLAIFPAIAVTALINYLGSAFYVFPNVLHLPSQNMRWRVAAIGVVAFCILLRLIYLGLAQLIPDEAYYWQYAQHMDLSFYDHPPMVAWLIWLSTAVFGDNEIGVRAGAFICSLIAMGFLYAYAKNLYDKSTALRTILLFSVLPMGFVSGFLMTPDAPLGAAWIAALYFMERALVANQQSAWLGMGIAFGLGLLSKYTLGLLGLAALVFVLLDPVARRWMGRPHPYLVLILALFIFSPVLIWNFQHDWASFAFQSTRHIANSHQFSVHFLLIYIMILLTPIGFIAVTLALIQNNSCKQEISHSGIQNRKRLFVQIMTGVPFLVFLVFSTFDHPKFHWTGPVWLAVLPTIAWMLVQPDGLNQFSRWLQRAWGHTITICLLIYALTLHYLVLGIPGVPYHLFTEHYFWRETTQMVEQITEEVRQQTGMEPIVVGMSKWSVASSLYFYNHARGDLDIRSRNLFGDTGAMYNYWFPSQPPTNRPIIQIGMRPKDIEHIRADDNLKQMLIRPGEIQYRTIRNNKVFLRRVYYRIAKGFKGLPT
ncbi:MAG: glycosyltransferase family 39 protein [Burkholderiales bacterium]|uniref:glycosyltransferase family 39 protein n=1 Tax=Nitrosomonas sp. TaxID=42353 RepID=UPI001DCE17FB|nr:glycosyltransferase family 39 protein [Nitrosomonas sp.]MCB1949983.1 glycosyltransferase family 39 protein [Nitrosomonas sp.]MCP5243367.1 glycosyltransferase family 39 protein [Burkholderiales bacterium]